ncbi:MAG: hypothetical protein OK454_05975, partial [Thaumarchaeota archaeon]|nr:hypothetical protein [Nitrososphaerota archaeon]
MVRLGFPNTLLGGNATIDSSIGLLSDLIAALPANISRAGGGHLHFQITQQGPRGEVREINFPLGSNARESRPEPRREIYQEPQHAVAFAAQSTMERWLEEARMVFGLGHADKAVKLTNLLLAKLMPTAQQQEREHKAREAEEKRKLEQARKEREEAERKATEAKEAEERAAR